MRKLLLTVVVILICFCSANGQKKQPLTESSVVKDTIHFASQIQPILIKNCSPCHFTGGKMYERMPFDKDTTIINHQAGILKRIKGEENTLIRSFVQQQSKQ